MKKYLLLIILIIAMSEMADGQTRYVTPTGAGEKNGMDWLNAYDSTLLQFAIDQVADLGFTEVWVAAGTYTPGEASTSHFSMRSGVAIYGGFSGNESSLEERNWVDNVTILSGEIGIPGLNTDNIHSVFYNSEINNTAILDGFIIQDGYSGIGLGGSGGGMFNFSSSPMIRNCIFTRNTASFGAGMYNSNSSSPTLINCIITNNYSRRGGGIFSNGSTPSLINCKVTNNMASITGGGVESSNSSATTLINCTVAGNSSATFGGGVYSIDPSTTTIHNSIIWGNQAMSGGSQVYVESGTVILDYSTYAEGANNVGTNTGGTFTATNSIVLDPQFVIAEGTEFLIAGSSPAVDAGLDIYNNEENDVRGTGFGRKLNKEDGSTGTIDMGAYEFNVATDPAGGTTYTWTGASNTDWTIAGNWDPATVPGVSDWVTIPGGVTNYPLINSAVEIYHLTIATEASVTIVPSGRVTVTNAVTNNGILTIQTNANGTGSLIAGNSGGTGITTVQSYLLPNIWNLVSSPVSGQTIAGFLTAPLNVTTIETNGTSRGMRDYNPETDTWNSPFTNSTEGSLGGGKGFAIKLQGSADALVTYSGSLQAGPVTVTTVLDQWNLVGNPYASAIGMNEHAGSAENFLTHNASSLDPVYGVYVWDQPDGDNQATGQFRAISNVPNPSFSGAEVKPGQGFLVKMKPTVTAVSFGKGLQIHPTDQAPADELWPTIELKATANGQESSTIIAFNSEMSQGLDPTYDVGLYKGASDLAIYTRLVEENEHSFAVQALPETRYDTLTIPVGIDFVQGGEVTFSAETFNIPDSYKTILEDRENNTFNDLSEGPYTATIDANTTTFERFTIRTSNFSGATFTWTGATDTTWHTAANWEPATIPGNTDRASIPGGITNYPTISGEAASYGLTIAPGASLTIAPTGKMTVADAIINNGTLSIQSVAEGTGSLISGSATGSGTTIVEKFLRANTWNMVSSPLAGQTIACFLTDSINLTNIETNGASRGMMDFNPQTDNWNNFFTNTTAGSLGGGKGFSVRLQEDTDAPVVFTGVPQTGPVTVSTVMDSWNSVGNPYTSAIGIAAGAGSVENFLSYNTANLDPVYGLYVWDHDEGNNQTSGQFRAISNVPSPTYADAEFLPGQAFLVKMNETSTTVGFTEMMQTHPTDQQPIEEPWPTIQLTISAGGQQSSTLVAFNNEMTHGLDTTYDAGLLKKDAELELYTRLVEDNGFSFAIQALPESGSDTLNIQVGIDSNMGGEVVFSADTFNLPSTLMAVLVDLQNNTTTNLSAGTYTATIEPNTSAFDRFLLRTSFRVGIDDKAKELLLSAYPIRNTEIRIMGKVSRFAIATLYDIQGKMVLIKTLEEGTLNSIHTPNLQSGIYLLSVKDNQQVQRFKIPVSQ